MRLERRFWRGVRTVLAVVGAVLLVLGVASVPRAVAQEKVLNIGLYIEPQNMDPHSVEVGTLLRELSNIYEGLIDVTDKVMVYEPVLATSWSALSSRTARTSTPRPSR